MGGDLSGRPEPAILGFKEVGQEDLPRMLDLLFVLLRLNTFVIVITEHGATSVHRNSLSSLIQVRL